MDRRDVQNGQHFGKMGGFVIREEEGQHIFDVKFIYSDNGYQLEMKICFFWLYIRT